MQVLFIDSQSEHARGTIPRFSASRGKRNRMQRRLNGTLAVLRK